PIERVRSEHHIAHFQPSVLPARGLIDHQAAAAAMGIEAVEATLKTTLRGSVWVLKDTEGHVHTLNAVTGGHMTPMAGNEARQLASAQYEGKGQPVAA